MIVWWSSHKLLVEIGRFSVWCWRADSRFAFSQWETALLCNDVSHWLGANLQSALCCRSACLEHVMDFCWKMMESGIIMCMRPAQWETTLPPPPNPTQPHPRPNFLMKFDLKAQWTPKIGNFYGGTFQTLFQLLENSHGETPVAPFTNMD